MDARVPRYLGSDELDALKISTADAVESIEELIRGRAEGRMWNAPKSLLLERIHQKNQLKRVSPKKLLLKLLKKKLLPNLLKEKGIMLQL